MAKFIENHIGLMEFFQEWGTQCICDYYEAERDLLGQEYCNTIDERYSKEKGAEILKIIIKEYPDAFRTLINENKLCVSEQLLQFLHDDGIFSNDYSVISTYLLSDDCDKNLKTICEALSKGFLLEWIFFYLSTEEKKQVISRIDIQKKELENKGANYREWKKKLIGYKLTRMEIIDEYSFYTHLIFYLYRRVYLGYSQEIIFHAINVSHYLRLTNSSEFIRCAIASHGIGNDVKNFYSYLCLKQHSCWKEERLMYILPDYQRTNKEEISGVKLFVDKIYIDNKEKVKDENNKENVKGEDNNKEKKEEISIIRSELLEKIKKACQGWETPKKNPKGKKVNDSWKVIWTEVFLFLWDIGLISRKKGDGAMYKRPNFLSSYVNTIIRPIGDCDKDFGNQFMNNYLYIEPILDNPDDKNSQVKSIDIKRRYKQRYINIRNREDVNEKINEFITKIKEYVSATYKWNLTGRIEDFHKKFRQKELYFRE